MSTIRILAVVGVAAACGCAPPSSNAPAASNAAPADSSRTGASSAVAPPAQATGGAAGGLVDDAAGDDPLPTISLGNAGQPPHAAGASDAPQSPRRASVIAALQPLQSLLGRWRGITRREIGENKGIDEPEWIWDLRTDRNQPALVATSPQANVFRSARLTWLTNPDRFQMTLTDSDGRSRVLEGTFSEPVEEFQEAGTTLHKKFKLQLDEQSAAAERWRIVINQQNNDRYLLELSRARGADFVRFDTVGHQRQGTSFAQDDADYGERKCIISGGLGTIQVRYQGKSYWVCCTGCEAAFNEDPEGWLKEAQTAKR
ncbi:MAG: hypothetical protein KF774_18175 [Planctomyces sp.]|nr:hypothetical protein [Planctomyces sp.]